MVFNKNRQSDSKQTHFTNAKLPTGYSKRKLSATYCYILKAILNFIWVLDKKEGDLPVNISVKFHLECNFIWEYNVGES